MYKPKVKVDKSNAETLSNRVRISADNQTIYEGKMVKCGDGLLTIKLDDGTMRTFDVGIDIEI